MYGIDQYDPELERIRALQESAASVTPHPEAPTWNFHTTNRAAAVGGLLVCSWMFLTFMARLIPDFAFIYTIISAAALIACFYVAIAGKPELFQLVGISAFVLIFASLLAGWDLILGLFYYQNSPLWKIFVVAIGFLLSALLIRVFFSSRTAPKPAEQQTSTNQDAYNSYWEAFQCNQPSENQ